MPAEHACGRPWLTPSASAGSATGWPRDRPTRSSCSGPWTRSRASVDRRSRKRSTNSSAPANGTLAAGGDAGRWSGDASGADSDRVGFPLTSARSPGGGGGACVGASVFSVPVCRTRWKSWCGSTRWRSTCSISTCWMRLSQRTKPEPRDACARTRVFWFVVCLCVADVGNVQGSTGCGPRGAAVGLPGSRRS